MSHRWAPKDDFGNSGSVAPLNLPREYLASQSIAPLPEVLAAWVLTLLETTVQGRGG